MMTNNQRSRQSLKKFVKANNNLSVTDAMFDSLFNKALRSGVEKGVFEQPKGASGGTKLAKKAAVKKEEKVKKPAVKKVAKKPAAKPAAKKAAPKKEGEKKKAAPKKDAAAPKKAAPKKVSFNSNS
jgi:histone H1/5